MIDVLGVDWIQHFNRCTESRIVGGWRLLILDGYSSYTTPEFDIYCIEHNIVTICMPSHTSHLLQPLDVGCFSPLKAAYRNQVHELARRRVFYIDKVDFLQIYKGIRNIVFSAENIHAGFRALGLVPVCPERVLSSLIVVRTPLLPRVLADAEGAWVAETP